MTRTLSLITVSLRPSAVYASGCDIQIYPLTYDSVRSSRPSGESKSIINRSGYANRAGFTRDDKGEIFTSDRSGQINDIYRCDIASGKITQLTGTPDESEFSPADENAGECHFAAADARRGIRVIPEQIRFSYVHKTLNGDRVVRIFDPVTRWHQVLVSLGSGSEDYALFRSKPSGLSGLFNAGNMTLRAWPFQQGTSGSYETSRIPVTDLKTPADQRVSAGRMAVSPDNQFIIIWTLSQTFSGKRDV